MVARYVTAILLLVGGWLAILTLAPFYHSASVIYWIAGGLALTVSLVGGVLYMVVERAAKKTPDTQSHPN